MLKTLPESYEPLFKCVLGIKLNQDKSLGNRFHLFNDTIIHYATDKEKWGMDCRKISIKDFSDKVIDWICDMEQAVGICSHKAFNINTDGDRWYAGFIHWESAGNMRCQAIDISCGPTKEIAIIEAGIVVLEAKIK